MPANAQLREGPITAVDTRTALATRGSDTAPGLLKTGTDDRMLSYIVASCGSETPTTTTQGGVQFVRLAGKALGEEIAIMLGGSTSQIATAGESGGGGFVIAIPMDLPLKTPGEYMEIYGEMAGVEASDPNIAIAPVLT